MGNKDVMSVEQLYNRLAGITLSLEQFGDDLELIETTPIEEPWAVSPIDDSVLGRLFVSRDIVLNGFEMVGLAQIPTKFSQAAECLSATLGPAETGTGFGQAQQDS